MVRYQQEMIRLGRRTAELDQFTQLLLEQMEGFEKRQVSLVEQTGQEIDRTIIGTGAVVLALQVVLALLLVLIHKNMFTHHISKPMEKVRKRLLKFQEGDYSSPMSLNRNDEWGQIEQVFDGMLTDLVESWSALQESERRYRNIFDSASEGIFQSTVEGAFLDVNPAMGRMYGLGFEDNLNAFNSLREQIYVDPADRDRLITRLLVEESINDYQVQMRRINGETFWATINCHLVRDKNEQVKFIEGTVEDISLRRQAEEALQQLKEYLHAIIDTMPSILIGISGDKNVTLWNRQTQKISGIKEDQAVGQPLNDVFSLIEPVNYLDAVNETLQTGEVARLLKIPGSRKDQECFYDILIYPLTDSGAGGAVIHMDDVSEKVQIETVMVQSEKMLSIGSLAAGMAHEINNPLASVLQNIQVMNQRLSPSLDKNRQTAEQLGISMEQVAEYARLRGFEQMMDSISSAGQRAARIIENMLNFSRKSSSNFLHCSMTSLLEITLELAASDYDMKHQFDFRSIKITRDYQPVPDVLCEAGQIQQVFLSLLKNAAQALSASVEQPEIQIRVFARDEQLCVQIEDNGIGMEEATCKRAFEPFYTTKEVGVGTGLGLSVAYFLITENHKGSLTLKSEPGKGSCFTIMLPLC
jgi:PAS domain S-box-containing protein